MIDGSCHCGTVTWQFNHLLASATACNCTVCRRYGVLWAYGSDGDDIHLSGSTTVYTPGKNLGFHFCATCGCLAYWRALSAGEQGFHRTAVKVRLAEPDTVATVPVRYFDGLDTFKELPNDSRCVSEFWI